jgi:hypothetical protein
MVGRFWWKWALAAGLCLPVISGCGRQRDQTQPNRGLDRPKQPTVNEGEIPNPNKEIPTKPK